MDPNVVAWAPYLIGGALLMAFKPGRKLIGLIVALSIGLVLLMIASEPDL